MTNPKPTDKFIITKEQIDRMASYMVKRPWEEAQQFMMMFQDIYKEQATIAPKAESKEATPSKEAPPLKAVKKK